MPVDLFSWSGFLLSLSQYQFDKVLRCALPVFLTRADRRGNDGLIRLDDLVPQKTAVDFIQALVVLRVQVNTDIPFLSVR